MKKLNKVWMLLFFVLLSYFANGQESLIYQKIETQKKSGEKFSFVSNVFFNSTINESILKEFKDPKKVSFLDYNVEIYDQLEKTISINLPLQGENLVLELEAVENEYYSYTVTTEKGDAYPANRTIKHYRGIIKGDKSSLVALSFSKESINGIVANNTGNYNLSSINNTKSIVFFQDNNPISENTFICGLSQNDIETKELQSLKENLLNNSYETLSLNNMKCLRIYFELRYDMYQRYGAIHSPGTYDPIALSKTVGYFSSVFNQVALLFFNEGINAYISELKINTSPDIYPEYQFSSNTIFQCNGNMYKDNSLCIYNSFGNNLSNNYNGDIAQLISLKNGYSWGVSLLHQNETNANKTICQVNKKALYSYAGLGVETDNANQNLFSNYSKNIYVIIHELGHVLGSPHTQACVWVNGNVANTAIDNCGPYAGNNIAGNEGMSCYDPSNPILPPNGGTIMSYCHLLSNVNINLNNGYGQQPGSRIFSKICATCTNPPIYCFENIHIGNDVLPTGTSYDYINSDYEVVNGALDSRSASNNIVAVNTIKNGGTAIYKAGNSIVLKPVTGVNNNTGTNGFRALKGSTVLLKIETCNTISYTTSVTDQLNFEEEENQINYEPFVNLYPNPTPDIISIESNYEITFWELTNDVGSIYKSGKVENLKKVELNFSSLYKGVYNIKIHFKNGKFSYKKMIKQ